MQLKLNTKDIDKAIKEIQGRKRMLDWRIAEAQEALSELAVSIAREKCLSYAKHNHELADSIKASTYYKDGKFTTRITAGADSAAFFEFGTGIMGEKKNHPTANRRGWDYGPAWYTKADGKDMEADYGWKPHVNEDGSVYYFTTGQPAKPFMYETLQELRMEYPRIMREVFSHKRRKKL